MLVLNQLDLEFPKSFFSHFAFVGLFFFVLFKIRLSLNFMKLLVAEIKYIIQITYIIDVKYKNGIYNK